MPDDINARMIVRSGHFRCRCGLCCPSIFDHGDGLFIVYHASETHSLSKVRFEGNKLPPVSQMPHATCHSFFLKRMNLFLVRLRQHANMHTLHKDSYKRPNIGVHI